MHLSRTSCSGNSKKYIWTEVCLLFFFLSIFISFSVTLSPTSLYLARSHKSEPWSYSFFLWQYFFFESVSTYLIVMGISNVICPLSLYFVNAFSVHLAFSPPNPPVKRQDCCTGTPEKDSLFEQRVQLITFLSKVNFIALPSYDTLIILQSFVWFFTCLNTAGALSSHNFSLPRTMTQSTSEPDCVWGFQHLILIIGTTLTLFSAVLRLWFVHSYTQHDHYSAHILTVKVLQNPRPSLHLWNHHPSQTWADHAWSIRPRSASQLHRCLPDSSWFNMRPSCAGHLDSRARHPYSHWCNTLMFVASQVRVRLPRYCYPTESRRQTFARYF